MIAYLIFNTSVFSQEETNIWYFGLNAGLDFASGSPVAINGQTDTLEGTAVMSTNDGELQFYTDGKTVWNKNHQIMSNGTGLLGHTSSSQSALIVPNPSDSNIFYLFTTDVEGNPNGLNYSVIDITLNGGLGDVTSQKNIQLKTPVCEKITAVKNDVANEYWVVAHGVGNNEFYSYRVTSSGVVVLPVISALGTVVNNFSQNYTIGHLKFSPDATKIACLNLYLSTELFDFDIATGQLSNSFLFYSYYRNDYGVEFSPSGNLLYISFANKILQYNLAATDIVGSEVLIYEHSTLNFEFGALQLGNDGKIYCAARDQNYISAISHPDVVGAGCNFILNAVNLGSGICRSGLPQFVQSYFVVGFDVTGNCLGTITTFTPTSNTTIISAAWDFGDGNNSTDVVPSHTYTNPGTYTVTVTFSNGTDITSHSKQVTINQVPIMADNIPDQIICGAADLSYELSQFSSSVLGGQPATTFGVAYFSSLGNAVAHENSLSTNQIINEGTTMFFVKVFNLNNTSCYVIDDFQATLFVKPVAYVPTPYIICESPPYDSIDNFYLSTKNNEILNGQDLDNFSISYHSSQAEADSNSNELPTSYINTLPIETIYARIESNSNIGCFSTTSFEIKVVQVPNIISVTDYRVCDDAVNDGFALFDLSTKTTEILDGQSSSIFTVNYYFTLSDAQNNTNEILTPFTNNSINQVIFYTITANGSLACKASSSLVLKVDVLPKNHIISDLFLCDDLSNDGLENFNLNMKNIEILGYQDSADFSVLYYTSFLDAQNNSNPLPSPYTNSSNPQTIFARIHNTLNTTCYVVESFQIEVHSSPNALKVPDWLTCDDIENNGKELFDLNLRNGSILGPQDPTLYSVTYHSSFSDAEDGTNALPIPYENSSNPQAIYARASNSFNAACFSISSFEIAVLQHPLLDMEDVYSICKGFGLEINATPGFSSYEWSTGVTGQNIVINEPGNYSITVSKNYDGIICSTIKNFLVYNSEKAHIVSVETEDWTANVNTITVIASGNGEYEYSLNGLDFQDSNQFSGLPPGDYLVHVRDKNGCGTVQEEIFLLSYPKYFTPNGDSYNDYWQINFSHVEPGMRISVFDRYGKLITNFNGEGPGWDGNYNGKPLPSSDYWFLVERDGGKEYKGHFSLKR